MSTPSLAAMVTGTAVLTAAFSLPHPANAQSAHSAQVPATFQTSSTASPSQDLTTETSHPSLQFRGYKIDDYEVVTDYQSRALTPPPAGYYYADTSIGIVMVTSSTHMITELAR